MTTRWRIGAARRLLSWFARFKRDVPWRQDRDPYRIWVSEIMLQQTQVATVVPYFQRFIQAFPTLHALATASEQNVLRLWEGLGYYRRARDLHKAAKIVAAEHGGVFPRDPESVGRLPGLGRYTRNAVLSQAFDLRLPVVEANTRRVLSRLFARRGATTGTTGERWLWQAAESILPRENIGAFNQALMELGSMVCTPAKPKCGSCPLKAKCQARLLGLQDTIPPRAVKPAVIAVQETAVVIRDVGKVLLVQRPVTGRWAGMWEFPHGPYMDGEAAQTTASRIAVELTGLQVRVGPQLSLIRHNVTRYSITLSCFEAIRLKGKFRSPFYVTGVWLAPKELEQYPVSAPQRRIARMLTHASHGA